MQFTKMHGIGNDYVYVNGFAESVADPVSLAVAVSDRHFGIGGDGLILILPAEDGANHARMRVFNADGSEAEMCGNGVRCVAKYVHDHGLCDANPLRIETGGGLRVLQLTLGEDGKVETVRVDMGRPALEADAIPTTLAAPRAILAPLTVGGLTLELTCVSMGNPHAVCFVDDVEGFDLERIGPLVENHPAFPRRVNFHVARRVGRGEIIMRTWERGSGITLACGTGACAVCVAGALIDQTDRAVLIHLPGGDLTLDWTADDRVYMTGPATEVFTGDWPEE